MVSVIAFNAHEAASKYDYIQDAAANEETIPVDRVASKHIAAIQVGKNNFPQRKSSSTTVVPL